MVDRIAPEYSPIDEVAVAINEDLLKQSAGVAESPEPHRDPEAAPTVPRRRRSPTTTADLTPENPTDARSELRVSLSPVRPRADCE